MMLSTSQCRYNLSQQTHMICSQFCSILVTKVELCTISLPLLSSETCGKDAWFIELCNVIWWSDADRQVRTRTYCCLACLRVIHHVHVLYHMVFIVIMIYCLCIEYRPMIMWLLRIYLLQSLSITWKVFYANFYLGLGTVGSGQK